MKILQFKYYSIIEKYKDAQVQRSIAVAVTLIKDNSLISPQSFRFQELKEKNFWHLLHKDMGISKAGMIETKN